VAAILIGNGLAAEGAPTGYDPAGNLAYLRAHSGTAKATIGLSLELVGFALFAFFLARLWAHLRSAEGGDGVLSMAALVGGITMLAIKLGSGAELLAMDQRRDTMSAEQVQQLVDVGGATFLLSFLPFGVLLVASGLVVARRGGLPRWLGWVALALGVGNIGAVLAGPETMVVLPFLLGLLWIIVTSVLIARRSTGQVVSIDPDFTPAYAGR